ncbi:MAG TPA: CoA-binding protein [Casimicrobiaceae bacterium]|nr:CoA-binding protein [Casimicrobiaceae bacterium]
MTSPSMEEHRGDGGDALERFAPLFAPSTVAVLGASASTVAQGNRFIRLLRAFGFPGEIYPIHPRESSIEGLPVYRSLGATPRPVDYAFIAVARDQVPALLEGAAGRVRFAQVMSSGFGEIEAGVELQDALVCAARKGGARLIGPNCMGTYSAQGRLTFAEGVPSEPGPVGVMSQSGGLAIDLLQRGGGRGLRFSGVVSMGNCADLGANEFLDYFLADPQTRVIGAYVEHVRDGRAFFEQLRRARAAKPVVILKGGRTHQGQTAAASHTGSLADDDRAWMALARQTGTTLVDTLDEFLDCLVAFQSYAPRLLAPTGDVVLFGNGGGTSVLAVDGLARRGLVVEPLGGAIAQRLEGLDLPAGTSVTNPIDIPANVLRKDRGALARQLLEIVADVGRPEAIAMHLNLSVIIGYRDVDMLGDLIAAAADVKERFRGRTHVSLALRSNGGAESEARRRASTLQAMARGLPVFEEMPQQARAIAAVHEYERFRHARGYAR